MNNMFIYDRTEKARDARVANALAQPYRRFLLLIDGTRSLAELATVARPGELDQTIHYLVEQGYVRKISESSLSEFGITNLNDPFSQAALTEDMFVELKSRIIDEALEKFGENARSLVDRVEACSTPQDLRVCLRIADSCVTGAIDAGSLRQFVQRVGRNLV